MKGVYLKINVGGTIETTETEDSPTLDKLKEGIGGGYVEIVPRFNRIEYNGEITHCVVFCDEDGKRKGLPVNIEATGLWQIALRLVGHPGLYTPDGRLYDYLVGQILVVMGDEEFMEEL
jgi:hypothetical protein